MKNRFIILIVLVSITALMLAPSASAEGAARLYASDLTLYPGNSRSVYIQAENLENLGAVDFSLYYDSSVITVTSAGFTGLLSGAFSDVNITANSVNFSAVSTDAITGSGSVAVVNLTVDQNAVPGEYTMTLAVGDAYTTSLTPAEISGSSFKLTVMDNVTPYTPQNFRVYAYSPGSFTVGEEFSVSFNSYYVSDLCAIDLVTDYDESLLELQNVAIGSALSGSDSALWAVNDTIPGYIKTCYISPGGVSGYLQPLITYTFKVIANTDDTAVITLCPQNVCDSERRAMNTSDAAVSVSLYKTVEEPELPKISLQKIEDTADHVVFNVVADKEINLAAGDFTVTFDNQRLECTEAKKCDVGMVVSKINNETGKITFSFIYDGGLTEDKAIFRIEFQKSGDMHADSDVLISGRNIVNDNLTVVDVTYVSSSTTTHDLSDTGDCVSRPKCPVCGLEFGEINQNNHQWSEPEFEWSADHSSAEATFVCSKCSKTVTVDADVIVNEDPEKRTYTASADFNGQTYYLPVIVEYFDYTVQFVDYNGTVISTATYHYGDTVTVPADPSRPADNVYTYTFDKWTPAITAVTGNATYTATYTSTYIDYMVRFVDYNGAEISTATYHYGDTVTVPADPSRPADNVYTYTFDKWTPAVTAVTGNATYTATYTSTYIDYTVRFVDYDGTEISAATYHYGDTVTVPADPSRPADNTYTYTFDKWTPAVTAVAGNATYTATYTSTYIDYTVRFVDYNGTVISTAIYHYGDTVTVPANPSRAADNTYTYAFDKWTPKVTAVICDATYIATYTATYIDYTVKFVDYNGDLIGESTYHYGDTVTVPANPSRAADNTYTYAFDKWTPAVTTVTGNATYTATYIATYINYTVKFVDYNGTVISSATYHYGNNVTVPADPSRPADNTYTYAFDKWTPTVTAVTGNATYTAIYTSTYIDYTVSFVDYNGAEISTATYHYGDAVAVPANPSRPADNTYTYAFDKWTPTVSAVTGDATYTATYTSTYIDYTVKFVDYNGDLISESTYHYGDTVTVPANPSRAADNTYTYAFDKWTPAVTTVTGNATYTATYIATYINYTVTFVDYNGTVISNTTYHYGDAVTVPVDPSRAADNTYTYTFDKWTPAITVVKANVTYTATYTSTYIEYTVRFVDYNGTEISAAKYHYGDAVAVPADPSRPADNTYTYAFDKWTPAVSAVTGDATYTATYTSTYIDYTVKFVDYNGDLISESTYHYGDTAAVPANPSRAADNTYTYAFDKWTPSVTTVMGNATYTATYIATYINYTVTFVDYNGSVISTAAYHYGDTVTVPANPNRAADNTYTYAFDKWTPTVTAVTGNATYTATYTSTYIDYTVRFVDYNGAEISTATYHYGDTAAVPANPSRAADNTYTYVFDKWTPEVTKVTGDTTYMAVYTAAYIDYTVKFVDYDNSLISEAAYHYGDTVTVPANPSRAADNTYTYSFDKWTPSVTTVMGNATYTATYIATYINYTVTFVDYNGTVISNTTYHYGDNVTVPADPSRPADNTYTYTFDKWTPAITVVKANATYTATYKATYIDYTVKFVDYNGAVISAATYHCGDTVTVPENPSRTSDDTYYYVFTGWTPEITTVKGSTEYTAVYDAKAHEWSETAYEWTADHGKATASRYSKNDPSVVQTETVQATVTRTEPSCEQNGKITYTATFANPAFAVQAYEETLPATGHSYGEPEWIWSEYHETAKAKFTCSVCHDYVTVNAAVTIVQNGNMNTYTAKAAFNGEEYTDTVTVQMFIYGDVNGDGRIDGRDLIRLRKYLATYNDDTGTGDVEIFAGADMNGDGVVNGKDLIRLRKYLVTNDNNVSNDAPLIAGRVIPLIITSVPDKRFMQIK